MKRRLSILLCIALCLMMFPSAPRADAVDTAKPFEDIFTVGDGTADSPYQISDLEDLEYFSYFVNYGLLPENNLHFKLTADVDMSETYHEDGESWTAIGTESAPFSGTFDGGGHTITGLYVNAEGNNQGLFGYVGLGGAVKSLGVSGYAYNYRANTGGVVGYNMGMVENCLFTGDPDGVYGYIGTAGGIVGYNTGTVINCYNTNPVGGYGGSSNFGGVVGRNDGGSVINCYSVGEVGTGYAYTGGVVGRNDGGSVENCYYLEGTVADGDCGVGVGVRDSRSDTNGVTESKTTGQFASGEVAWLLQYGLEIQFWGQVLDTDAYPVLSDDPEKQVLKVTFKAREDAVEDEGTVYVNPNGTVDEVPELPGTLPDGTQWCADGLMFTAETPVTENLTVLPGGPVPYSPSLGTTISTTYGTEQTMDLDSLVSYEDGWSNFGPGHFQYTVLTPGEWGGGDLSDEDVIISGSTLTIPGSMDVRTNANLAIQVLEVKKHYSPRYVREFSATTVTLNISVTVEKASRSKPTVSIDYENEALLGVCTDMEYSLTGADDDTWTPCGASMELSEGAFGWDGTAPVTVYFRYTDNSNYNGREAQTLVIPARSAAPEVTLTLTKTSGSITVTGTSSGGAYKFSVNETDWSDGSLTGLSAGTGYTVYVRTVGTADTFASLSMAWPVTTVNADGSATLKPGETVGVITNHDGTVTMGDGTKVTTVRLPAGTTDAEVDSDNRVTAPGGSIVLPYGGANIVVGGSGASADRSGDVILPAGGSAVIGTVTVTLPSGGTLDPDCAGDVAVPGGADINGVTIPREGCIIIRS